jgi:hypothetical protein
LEKSIRLNVSLHAFRRLLERGIALEAVESVIRDGVAIREYPDDRPLPSKLFLGYSGRQAIHVVAAWDAAVQEWRVVTAYWPDPSLWEPDHRTRRES